MLTAFVGYLDKELVVSKDHRALLTANKVTVALKQFQDCWGPIFRVVE